MGLELMGTAPSPALRSEIARSVAELDQLIDEILLASRLDAREADVGTVEPVELVALAAEECAQVGAELDVAQSEVLVPGVPRLLRRALRNLLENARRYASSDGDGDGDGDQDGHGDVSVSVRQSPDGLATITVSDRGPGVPVAERTRIFEPFYRMRRRVASGTAASALGSRWSSRSPSGTAVACGVRIDLTAVRSS